MQEHEKLCESSLKASYLTHDGPGLAAVKLKVTELEALCLGALGLGFWGLRSIVLSFTSDAFKCVDCF